MSNHASQLNAMATVIRRDRGMLGKNDIHKACQHLSLDAGSIGQIGDDCAVLPQGDAFTLYAIEGFMNEFVEADPWFAGWCGVMVNISDILAMGGRPTAVVNALWARNEEKAAPILAGMRAASEAYGVPIVGGHSNFSANQEQLSVSILGHANKILSSFEAQAGDHLMIAVDLRGDYRAPFDNWQAALNAPHERLRGDMALLPELVEKGLAMAAKDISQGGIVGTSLMMAECSNVGIDLDLESIPRPQDVSFIRWLRSFPSFGFLLSVKPDQVQAVQDHFATRDITCGSIGRVVDGGAVTLCAHGERAVIWDHTHKPYLGLSRKEQDHA